MSAPGFVQISPTLCCLNLLAELCFLLSKYVSKEGSEVGTANQLLIRPRESLWKQNLKDAFILLQCTEVEFEHCRTNLKTEFDLRFVK